MTVSNSLVDTDWLHENAEDPQVALIEVDWDGLDSFKEGHIPGAIGWNWKAQLWDPFEREFPQPDLMAERLGRAGISNDTTIVIYGAPVQFGTYAWWVLKMFGHQDVRLLDGGKVKWQREGRQVTTDPARPGTAHYQVPTPNMACRAGRDDVLTAIDDAGCLILDHRSFEEYSGQRVGLPGKPDVGAERYGRVPGAKHIPFDSLINEDTTFKSPDELKRIIGEQVADPHTQIISYCRLAHRATLASFVMTELLGFTNVRVYDGSWTEWGSMVGMPIER